MTIKKRNIKTTQFKNHVLKTFNLLKSEKFSTTPSIVPIYTKGSLIGYLRTVSKSAVDDMNEIKRLSKWRKQSEKWFPAQFKITDERTKKWFTERLMLAKDRYLFMIESPSGRPIGHIGLFRFNFENYACEIDNVIRGESDIKGIMTYAILVLINWSKKYLGVTNFTLEVFSDNEKAINLYKRCGFLPSKKIPLKKVKEKDQISWIEDPKLEKKVRRYNLYMTYPQNG